MKKCFLLLLLFLGAANLFGQMGMIPSRPNGKGVVRDGFSFGVRAGVNSPRLYYTNKHLKVLPHDFLITPSVGLYVEIPFLKMFSVAPEVNYQKKGGATSYLYEQDYHVKYQLLADYISLRLPVFVYLPISQRFRPYLFLGADAGTILGGKITLDQPGLDIASSTVTVNSSNINPLYVGALTGVGVRMNIPMSRFILVVKIDAALNLGFIDTFSEAEHSETAVPTNVHAYNHGGERYSRGGEIHVSFGFIRGEKDACYYFDSHRRRR